MGCVSCSGREPPVTTCVNEHLTCGRCRSNLRRQKCPSCSASFRRKDPIVLQSLAIMMPQLCKNYKNGCKELSSISDDHELFCEFRPMHCVTGLASSYCGWSGSVKDWLLHHTVNCDNIQNDTKHLDFINTLKSTYRYYASWIIQNSFHKFEDDHFLLSVWTKNGKLHQTIKHIPVGRPKYTYYIRIRFVQNNDILYCYDIRATHYDGAVEKPEDSMYCMSVPLEELEKLVDFNGHLFPTFTIRKVPFVTVKEELDNNC